MAQVTMSCDICRKERNVLWCCIDCQIDCHSSDCFKMCDECKYRHSKMPETAKHQIQRLCETKPENALLKGKLKTSCHKHPQETYRLFCKACNILACSLCQEEFHIGHVMCGIDTFVEDNLCSQFSDNVSMLPIEYLARYPSEDGKYPTTGSPTDEGTDQYDKKPGAKPDEDNERLSIGLRSVSTITVDIPCVYFLKTISSDTVWVGCMEFNKAIKVRNNVPKLFHGLASKLNVETKGKEISKIEVSNPLDIAVTSDDKQLIASCDISYRSLLSSFLSTKTVASDYNSHLNLTPISVCIEKYCGEVKRLWIALKEPGNNFSFTRNSIRKLVGISKNGHVSKVIEKGPNGRNIFTIPWRIIHTGHQLCVIDKTETKSGRVISLMTTGNTLWSYCPLLSVEERKFYPTGISSVNDKVLIVDGANNTLHILFANGDVYVLIPLVDFDIEKSFSVDVDPDKKIWIGCSHDTLTARGTSKIHMLSFDGF